MKTPALRAAIVLTVLVPLVELPAVEESRSEDVAQRVQLLLDSYAGAEDLLDERLLRRRADLEAMGTNAFPALCKILLKKTDDPVYSARIIEVFRRVGETNGEAVAAVRTYVNTHRNEATGVAQHAALRYLNTHGGDEDVELFAWYAESGDIVARTIARSSRLFVLQKNVSAGTNAAASVIATNRVDEKSPHTK